MRCEEFEIRLNEVLDERRTFSSAPELVEHARQCGACGELVRGYQTMLAGLSCERPAAPAWLTERVVQEALLKSPAQRPPAEPAQRPPVEPAQRPPVESGQRLPLLALAASVLIAAGVMWWNGSRQALPNKNMVGGDRQVAQTNQARSLVPQAAPSVEAPRATPAVEDSADHRSEDDSQGLDGPGILPGSDWAPAGAEWAHEVAEGLRPVTRPTVGAISGFLNLWGIADEGRQS